jgi:hypothetical protein
MIYLRKPFEGEAGMVPLLRGEWRLKLSKLSPSRKSLHVFKVTHPGQIIYLYHGILDAYVFKLKNTAVSFKPVSNV